jgi:hypothetical protein
MRTGGGRFNRFGDAGAGRKGLANAAAGGETVRGTSNGRRR